MRKPYPSDLTDEQWEIIKPLIPVNTVGRPRTAGDPGRKRTRPPCRPPHDPGLPQSS